MNEVITHKCPNCDGPLLFDPKTQKFHCEYCRSIFSELEIETFEKKETTKVTETPETEAKSTKKRRSSSSSRELENMELFSCPSCGAEIVTEATTAATYCYYCHNPVVVAGRISGKFLPESVLPFAIEKEEAVTQFLAWARKKKFVPRDFFNKAQVQKLTGVYFPYWAVDADLEGSLSANANSVSVWRVGEIEYTQTKKFRLYREGKMSFKELVKNALKKNSKIKMVESVQPFPLNQAVAFKSQYLAGFQAEKRDLEYQNLKSDIENELKDYGKKMLKDTISGYTTIYNDTANLNLNQSNHHYVLLPVWLVTYRNQHGNKDSKKMYYYAMNGYTGKVSGKLPINKVKLSLFSIMVAFIVFILFLIGGYLL